MTDDPTAPPPASTAHTDDSGDQEPEHDEELEAEDDELEDDELDGGDDGDGEGQVLEDRSARRVRSTRRRQDVPDLPRVPMEQRTIGRTFTARDGTVYRPSMFLTLDGSDGADSAARFAAAIAARVGG